MPYDTKMRMGFHFKFVDDWRWNDWFNIVLQKSTNFWNQNSEGVSWTHINPKISRPTFFWKNVKFRFLVKFVPVGKWRRHWPIRCPEDVFAASGVVRCSIIDPEIPKTQPGHSLTDPNLKFQTRSKKNLTNSKKKSRPGHQVKQPI